MLLAMEVRIGGNLQNMGKSAASTASGLRLTEPALLSARHLFCSISSWFSDVGTAVEVSLAQRMLLLKDRKKIFYCLQSTRHKGANMLEELKSTRCC